MSYIDISCETMVITTIKKNLAKMKFTNNDKTMAINLKKTDPRYKELVSIKLNNKSYKEYTQLLNNAIIIYKKGEIEIVYKIKELDMNLIEHRIEKIYSETIKGDIVTVVIDILCYGVVERKRTRMFLASEWEKIKKKGYYMA